MTGTKPRRRPRSPERGTATFRFYEELNDFLAPERRKVAFVHGFRMPVAIKDVIESLGVPHTEVEIILANGRSVNFRYRPRDGDRIAVYPMFESIDITPLLRLRPKPLRHTRFVVDKHLRALARFLRLLGFDALLSADYSAADLAWLSRLQRRVLLTRDRAVLKRSCVIRGYYVRAIDPEKQLEEIVARFDLERAVKPFTRCMLCNGTLRSTSAARLKGRVKPEILGAFERFSVCRRCGRVYWPGSHYDKLRRIVARVRGTDALSPLAGRGQG